MIDVLRSWLMLAGRRPRPTRHAARPVGEDLEARVVLAGSVTASIGGLTPPVVSVTIPQSTRSGVQDISLILKPSADDPQLLKDFLAGKPLRDVRVTLSDGQLGKDRIRLRDALITSYQLIPGPRVALSLEGLTSHTGSIAADIDGVMTPVLSLTVPQPTGSGAQDVSLVAKVSKGVVKLFQDAAVGKVIPEADITLDRLGNGSNETIKLTGAVISTIRLVADGETPTVEVTLEARQETIRKS
jgi:hypothetical protein